MKLVKMSLAAAMLMGASAFAIDNVKVSGDAKLFYGTNNIGTNNLFNQGTLLNTANTPQTGGSYADTALRLGVTGDLAKGISFGVTGYAISTLGLENNLVGQTWTGAHTATTNNGSQIGAAVNDEAWLGELWVAATLGKTTVKVGRMELDTPFAYSEKWSVVPNTFEAAVVLNQDIPDTTLVGAWVGKANGTNAVAGYNGVAPAPAVYAGIDGIMAQGAVFGTFASDGAYAAAIVNNSYKPLTAQAWYYNVVDVADAYWLQADINCQLVKGLKIGAQYADIDPKGLDFKTLADSKAYAFKLGYEGVKNLNVFAAYSKTDKDGTFKIANVATNNLGRAQSKLYTEAFWNYGYVGTPDAASWNVTAEYDAGIAKVGAYYTNVNVDTPTSGLAPKSAGTDLNEIAVTATKSFGALDATLAYVSTNANDQNSGKQYDTVLAMLKLNF